MSDDIWVAKKKKMLMIPGGKKTANETAKTTAPPTPVPTVAPAPVEPQKVRKTKPHNVKKVKQAPLNLADFRLLTSGDAVGIHIITMYQNQPIHRFSLLRPDYLLWQRMNLDQRYMFIRTRMNGNAFANNNALINAVVATTCQILDNIFAQAKRQQQDRRS